jgi:hypothetical protein
MHVPDDWSPFVPAGFELLRVVRGDLNADGRDDAVVVATPGRGDPQARFKPRALSIALSRAEGSFTLAAQNTVLAACATCGGRFGDALVRTAIREGTVVIVNEGGSATSGWSNEYTFGRDASTGEFVLIRYHAVVSSQRSQMSKHVDRTPADFGLRRFADVSSKDLPIPTLD